MIDLNILEQIELLPIYLLFIICGFLVKFLAKVLRIWSVTSSFISKTKSTK